MKILRWQKFREKSSNILFLSSKCMYSQGALCSRHWKFCTSHHKNIDSGKIVWRSLTSCKLHHCRQPLVLLALLKEAHTYHIFWRGKTTDNNKIQLGNRVYRLKAQSWTRMMVNIPETSENCLLLRTIIIS